MPATAKVPPFLFSLVQEARASPYAPYDKSTEIERADIGTLLHGVRALLPRFGKLKTE